MNSDAAANAVEGTLAAGETARSSANDISPTDPNLLATHSEQFDLVAGSDSSRSPVAWGVDEANGQQQPTTAVEHDFQTSSRRGGHESSMVEQERLSTAEKLLSTKEVSIQENRSPSLDPPQKRCRLQSGGCSPAVDRDGHTSSPRGGHEPARREEAHVPSTEVSSKDNEESLQRKDVNTGKKHDGRSSLHPSEKRRSAEESPQKNEASLHPAEVVRKGNRGESPPGDRSRNKQRLLSDGCSVSSEAVQLPSSSSTDGFRVEKGISRSSDLCSGGMDTSTSGVGAERSKSPTDSSFKISGHRKQRSEDEDRCYRNKLTDEESDSSSEKSSESVRKSSRERSESIRRNISDRSSDNTSETASTSQENTTADESFTQAGKSAAVGADSNARKEMCSEDASTRADRRKYVTSADGSGESTVTSTAVSSKEKARGIDPSNGADDESLGGEKVSDGREDTAVRRKQKRDGALSKDKEKKDRTSESFAWGLWQRPLAPSEASAAPSLLLLAAAGKKFQTEEQAKAFVDTLSEEHKQQLQRRHYRVATQMLHVPPFEPLPHEKFRHEAPPACEAKAGDQPALRLYTKKLLEQEKQLKALQLHDIVFANLYSRLRESFPERCDAVLYRMCKTACGLAKREGLPRVLEPLKRKLEDARFGIARERRKIRIAAPV